MEFLHYKAGDFHPEWRTGQEYVQADYLDPWWQIVVGYPGITEQEISDITRGPLRLGQDKRQFVLSPQSRKQSLV